MEKLWTKNLRDIEPYVPGEQSSDKNIVKLNANENPYPPSPNVSEVLKRFDISELKKYPNANSTSLKKALADYYGVKIENVFVGNGSDDVLAIAFQSFFNRNLPIVYPDLTYSFYPVWCSLFGINYKTYPVDDDFKINVEHYREPNGGEDIIVMYVRDYKDANKKSDDSSNSSSGNTKPDDNNNSNSQSSGNQIGSAKPNTSQSGNNAVIKPNTSGSASNNTAKDNTKSEADLKPEEKADNEQTDDTKQGNSDSNTNNGNSADNANDAITDEGNNNIETDKPNMKIIIPSIIGAILVVFIIMLFVIKRRKK